MWAPTDNKPPHIPPLGPFFTFLQWIHLIKMLKIQYNDNQMNFIF